MRTRRFRSGETHTQKKKSNKILHKTIFEISVLANFEAWETNDAAAQLENENN